MPRSADPFAARASLDWAGGRATYYRLEALSGLGDVAALPLTLKILLENVLRHVGTDGFESRHVETLASWKPGRQTDAEIPYLPARVLLQDYTGVPAVVDLAAMRSAMERLGGDPSKVDPLLPADLVIDHSVQVDRFGSREAFARNVEREYERNRERYALLRWAQQAFDGLSIVPPGTGICHQVNLEYLSKVVQARRIDGEVVAFPDTCVGTDSHTPMVNGLGVLAWGVGGIEAEGAMLGQPIYLLPPKVVGVRLHGEMPEGATATDLVLTVTEMLRKHGVVGRFVEYCGPGLGKLPVADRATIGNMAPEYGATAGLFPVDDETLRYLRLTGRPDELVDLVERYTKEQGLFGTAGAPEPAFDELVELDLGSIVPSLAGPRRPQDRVSLGGTGRALRDAFGDRMRGGANGRGTAADGAGAVRHGSVVIAAITSCTNTSNPSVMLAAGLLARKAVERGLGVRPWVKTSLAPGSRAVADYFDNAGLTPDLEKLGFHVVGYGCTTCIGNSGPLIPEVSDAVERNDLVVAAVLSGNRNFEGRIHPQVRASFLASPPLVVAYALAGTVDIDLTRDPLGRDAAGREVFLRDIWPSQEEIRDAVTSAVTAEVFARNYAHVFDGDDFWRSLAVPSGNSYVWDPASTYIKEPPFFENLGPEPPPPRDIENARVLVRAGDSITTDHISPAGSIAPASPAGEYLVAHGVERADFNSYGARRGNHEVMMRGTFANVRLRNELAPGKEGWWTRCQPDGEEMSIFDAAARYRADDTPTLVLAGKEYGTGSSRDWAAKGPRLLGVAATLAESYERIHRSNLVMMGILPLEFLDGEGRESLGLDGTESYTIRGIASGIEPGQELRVEARHPGGAETTFLVRARIDTAVEWEYYRHGGILPMVLRRLAAT